MSPRMPSRCGLIAQQSMPRSEFQTPFFSSLLERPPGQNARLRAGSENDIEGVTLVLTRHSPRQFRLHPYSLWNRRRLRNRDGRDPDGIVRAVVDACDRCDDLSPCRRNDEKRAGLHESLGIWRVKQQERIELLDLARAEIDRNTSSKDSLFREHPKIDRRAGSLVHEHEIRASLVELSHSDKGGGRHVRDLVPPSNRHDVLRRGARLR